MLTRHHGIMLAVAGLLVTAAAAFAQDDVQLNGTIPVPQQGTVPDNYYYCMSRSADVSPNHLVDVRIAHGCMDMYNYHPAPTPSNANTGNVCVDACTAQYNDCVAQSPQGLQDPACAENSLTCQRPCQG